MSYERGYHQSSGSSARRYDRSQNDRYRRPYPVGARSEVSRGNGPGRGAHQSGETQSQATNTNALADGSSMSNEKTQKEDSSNVSENQAQLSAEEKRKLRQAKLAKWKQKQGSPSDEPAQPKPEQIDTKSVTPPVTISKPIVISKKILVSTKLQNQKSHKRGPVLLAKKRNLFEAGDPEAETNNAFKKVKKVANLKEDEEQNHTVTAVAPVDDEEEDPLEKFMTNMESEESRPPSRMEAAELLSEEEDQLEENNDKMAEDSVAELMNQAKNINSSKEIPTIAPSERVVLKKFYNTDLNNLKEEDILEFSKTNQIEVKPENIDIRPVRQFDQLGLTTKMIETLQELNFNDPTPIQKITLPALMAGHDVVAVAKTGSGKTLAFVLPMIRHIVANITLTNKKKSDQTPIGLILTPTRELALQIHNDCKPFLKALGLRGLCCYGGSNISLQIAELKKGVELLVCTPGRLIDLLTANNGRVTNLTDVSSLVLDEADRMFDLGFEPQINKIIKNIRDDRQTCLVSATFAKKIEKLATKILVSPVQIVVGGGRSIVSDTITQRVSVVKPEDKFLKLLKILGDFIGEGDEDDSTDNANEELKKKVLVFCSTQERCDNILAQLLQRGYPGLSIHGGKDQVDRDGAISDFHKGVISILVATSIAARGLDVKDLGIVVNYDAPNHMEDYVHRVGRTGRAGKSGIAYTFVEPLEERAAHDIAKALRMSKNIVPSDVESLAESFESKLKEGKEKYTSGFGGKGLEKLDAIRMKTKNLERKTHGYDEGATETTESSTRPQKDELADGSAVDDAAQLELDFAIDFSIVDAPVGDKADARQFHSKIYINDLPQKVRVALSQQYPIISEAANVGITTRGTFVANPASSSVTKEDRLHILVECNDRMDLASAVSMLKNTIIEGIKGSNEEEIRKLKQGGSSGRYKV